MNLHRTPFNARNHEYYSEDPMLTAICGSQVVHGGLTKGMVLAAKHFAFNTQESFREGLCQFMEEQSARELELRAYEMLCDIKYVNSAGNEISALGLMSSFSRVGVYGVNSHTGVMKNILRKEWAFRGLSSSDMVVTGEFFNVEDSAINNVTFMASTGPQSLLNNYWHDWNNQNKVASDPDMCAALRENMHFYLYALANSSALNGIDPNFVVVETLSWWQPMFIAVAITFGALALASAALSVFVHFRGWNFNFKKEEGETNG
jgi:beta-glucosidase